MIEVRIKQVMSDVFNIDINSINDTSSPDNIENWDSLKHMNLIIALEEEFGVIFDDQEIVESMNYALIVNILKFK
jgi:acyl carrier protein